MQPEVMRPLLLTRIELSRLKKSTVSCLYRVCGTLSPIERVRGSNSLTNNVILESRAATAPAAVPATTSANTPVTTTAAATPSRLKDSNRDLRRQLSIEQQQHHSLHSSALQEDFHQQPPRKPLRRQLSLNADTRREKTPPRLDDEGSCPLPGVIVDARRNSVSSEGGISCRRDSRIAVHDGKIRSVSISTRF